MGSVTHDNFESVIKHIVKEQFIDGNFIICRTRDGKFTVLTGKLKDAVFGEGVTFLTMKEMESLTEQTVNDYFHKQLQGESIISSQEMHAFLDAMKGHISKAVNPAWGLFIAKDILKSFSDKLTALKALVAFSLTKEEFLKEIKEISEGSSLKGWITSHQKRVNSLPEYERQAVKDEVKNKVVSLLTQHEKELEMEGGGKRFYDLSELLHAKNTFSKFLGNHSVLEEHFTRCTNSVLDFLMKQPDYRTVSFLAKTTKDSSHLGRLVNGVIKGVVQNAKDSRFKKIAALRNEIPTSK